MAVRIITDSTCDLSKHQLADYDITTVPLKVIFGEKEYLDGIDLSTDTFYAMLVSSEHLPTTSQPSPKAFEDVFKPIIENGDDIVVIVISEKLSGTYQSASIAAQKCGGNIYVVDSQFTTIGLRVLLNRATQLRDRGCSAKEIFEKLEKDKKKIRLHAALDTLEYLKKGGRLSKTVAFAGTLLGIKPVIGVTDGVITVDGKARGQQKSYEAIWELVEKNGGIDYSRPFSLGYTGSKDDFKNFEKFSQGMLSGNKPMVSTIGAVIGTHVGPGAVAIAYFTK